MLLRVRDSRVLGFEGPRARASPEWGTGGARLLGSRAVRTLGGGDGALHVRDTQTAGGAALGSPVTPTSRPQPHACSVRTRFPAGDLPRATVPRT